MAIFTNQAILSYRNGVVSSNIVTGEIIEVLTVTKDSLLDTYSTGDTVTYVVGIFNSGATPLTGVTVTDDLGAYPFGATTIVPLTYVNGSMSYYVNGVLQPAPTVTVGTNIVASGLTIPANGYAQLIYQVRVNEFAPVAVGGQIINTVTATIGGDTYKFLQAIAGNGGMFYNLTYTALADNYDLHIEEVMKIIEEFTFR